MQNNNRAALCLLQTALLQGQEEKPDTSSYHCRQVSVSESFVQGPPCCQKIAKSMLSSALRSMHQRFRWASIKGRPVIFCKLSSTSSAFCAAQYGGCQLIL